MKPKLLVIVGPTASGKTSLSLRLAKELGGEIVSADSRQVYRFMDIGTAKAPISFEYSEITKSSAPEIDLPIPANRLSGVHLQLSGTRKPILLSADIPHHLIDIKNPDEDYSLAEYQKDATTAIQDIIARGKLPIMVGGTGLYVRAVVENLDIPNAKPDPDLRKKIEAEIESVGLEAVFQKLVDLDPEAAYIVDPKNPRRVIRALEITMVTGIPFSAQRKTNEPLFETLEVGITQPDEILRKRIDNRIDRMMQDGLVNEVTDLLRKYPTRPTAFDAIGYREIIDALDGKIPMDEAVALMKTNTWQYARRQMTWFRKDKKIIWIKSSTEGENIVRKFISTPRHPEKSALDGF